MFGNYIVAAWRSATRDSLHSIIHVIGLSFGLVAAILIALYVRYELSYDNFLMESERVYRIGTLLSIPGRPAMLYASAPKHAAAALSLDFPEFSGVARVTRDGVGVRHGEVEAPERILWADPGFLAVIGLKTIAGNAATALEAPDSVVLTRHIARKYFGTDAPLGGVLELDRKDPMRVTAVIEDLPANSHLTIDMIASGRASISPLAHEDAEDVHAPLALTRFIYVRLRPGATAAAVASRLSAFVKRHFPMDVADDPNGDLLTLEITRVRDIHLLPFNHDMKESVDPTTLAAIAAIGALVITIAAINFVNLMTARAGRRAVEVGVRKALGASRLQLICQFMCEAIGFTAVAALLAVALVALLLPSFDALLDRNISCNLWRDPQLAGAILALVLLVGLAAGLYPALVLSNFRAAVVLKSARLAASGQGGLRQALVVLQFAASIALTVATMFIARQTDFAIRESLRFDKDNVMLVRDAQACRNGFPDQVKSLPGIRGAVCSFAAPLSFAFATSSSTLIDGRTVSVNAIDIDFGFLEFYALPLLAGRYFDRAHAEDSVPAANNAIMSASIMINEAALRAYGFAAPAAALGKEVTVNDVRPTARPSRIIGVVPDFPIGTIREAVQPSVFFIDPSQWGLLSIKLDGTRIQQSLAEIDRLWYANSAGKPIYRMFLDSEIERLYRDIERQGGFLLSLAAVAIVIGCLGLFGLSAFTAERRTKEMGIRKAMGAATFDVTRLLIWQFVKPVVIANVIAWPISWWLIERWLDGFAYRIELSWVPFAVAGAGALAIAIATTGFHALQVGRQKPVASLRYE